MKLKGPLPPIITFHFDYIHSMPFIVLMAENAFWKYEVEVGAIAWPLGIISTYFAFNVWLYFCCDTLVYPMLDFKYKIAWLWVLLCVVLFAGVALGIRASRPWINGLWG